MDWKPATDRLCGMQFGPPPYLARALLDGNVCELRYSPGADAADLIFDVRTPGIRCERMVVRSAALVALAAGQRALMLRETGHPAFDRAFAIEAESPQALARWPDPDGRRAMEALQSAIGREPLWVTLVDDRIRIACRLGTPASSSMLAALQAIEGVARTTPGLKGKSGGTAAPRDPASSVCPVCGTTLATAIVRCSVCGTRCHRDCWRFAGACPVFTCGSQRHESQADDAEAVAVQTALNWLGQAVRELHRADSRSDPSWNDEEHQGCLRVKRLGFSDLLGELTRAAPRGSSGLLGVLSASAFHPVLAEDFGEKAFAGADARRAHVVEALTLYLQSGAALPDPRTAI